MKKLLSALLAAVFIIGMSASAFAAPASKITGFKGIPGNAKGDLGELNPRDNKKEIVLAYFDPSDFEWSGTAKSKLTMSDLSSGKVKLRYRVTNGKKAISSVRLALDKVSNKNDANYNKPAILLKLSSPFASLTEVDFEIQIYVYVQGQGSQTEHGFTVSGTLANPISEIEKGDVYADMRDGNIAQFNATCRNFEFEVTDEMSIWGTGLNKKKYWAYADTEPTEADEAIMVKYPSIIETIALSTINFSADLFTVKFHDLDVSNMYVYTVNSNGQLLSLGKSSQTMPLLSKYYLSVKEISGVKQYTAPTASSSSKG